ncbi:hypothetical protein [Rhodoligotrophos defluvii]|uniref:hypothetical protein n=1 Tax=Rhodoligotrophos defluvii TaxID=2561934 RepID=UPI0010C9707C|nr:hypothetical protein [Rhodoligotrophos defluvii]
MGRTIIGTFRTREDAELAVEHLVQEHGINRRDVAVTAADRENTAGEDFNIIEAERGGPDPDKDRATALRGLIRIATELDQEKLVGPVEQTFRSCGAVDIHRQ